MTLREPFDLLDQNVDSGARQLRRMGLVAVRRLFVDGSPNLGAIDSPTI
jgi:hypothetical protein